MLATALVIIVFAFFSMNRESRQSYNEAVRLTREQAAATAASISQQIRAELETALDAANTLAQSFSVVTAADPSRRASIPRSTADRMLATVLDRNPSFVGVYTCWEPNAFDGRDSQFAGKPGHDRTGRYIPYWCRNANGGVAVEPLVDYEKLDYYVLPRTTQRECVIEPLVYPVQGVDTLMTSLVVPIVEAGRFRGIAGVDMRLSEFQKKAEEMAAKLFGGNAEVRIYSNGGLAAGDSAKPDLVGKSIKERGGDWEQLLSVIQKGGTHSAIAKGTLTAVAPIQIGETSTPWSVVVTAPEKVVLAEAHAAAARSRAATVWMLIIGIVCAGIAVGLLWGVARRIGAPILELTRASEAIAAGDTDVTVSTVQMDNEIGQLSRSFTRMIEGVRAAADAAQQLAKGNLSISITPRSDKDVLSHSMITLRDSVQALVDDARYLENEATHGRLDSRADATRHQGEYRSVIEGINATLDSIVGNLEAIPTPIQFMDRDLRIQYINKTGADLLGHTKQQLAGVRCADVWQTESCGTGNCPCHRAATSNSVVLTDNTCTVGGKRMDIYCAGAPLRNQKGEVVGSFEFVTDQTEIRSAMRKAEKVSRYQAVEVGKVVNSLTQIAHGDLDISLQVADGDADTAEARANFVTIAAAIQETTSAIGQLVTDAAMLADAGVNGKLQTRADASKHQGQYRQVIEGFNATLDAVIEPLRIAADLIETVAYGRDFTDITAQMRGDYAAIKENGNAMRETLYGVLGALLQMGEAAERGDLDHRIDSSQFRGRWVDIIESMNKAYATVAEPFQRLIDHADHLSQGIIPPTITRDYKGQLLRAKEAYNTLFQTIRTLVEDATALAEAGVKGQLETRADASKHKGDFRKIVEGVNATLDAVVQPIQELQAVLERVAARDLTARVQGSYQGDFDAIKTATNRAIENLDEGLQQVAIGADQVASASVEISTGSQTLSQSASEQASSLEEISSSLQEMSSMTRQNAANAREATSLAESARHAAERGMESMTRMSEAMNRIKASSDQTARIVKTIDEIAFQTNLLALNAAVEAARAGDAGKGFAVVAEEVRNLAMRSAEAAKNTANLIEESVNNADDGVAINAEVLQHLQEINTQAHKVSEVMAEIAAASEQQTMGIDQVNGAVSQMDQLTQQNAANSEESASAAEELSSQAEEMRSMVAGFALSRSTGARPAHANVRPAAKLHHSGNGKGKPMAARPKPSAVIPLDDTEDAEVLQSF